MATITLNWTPVNDVNSTGQIVQRAIASAGAWIDIASLGAAANTYTDTTAVDNVLYNYRIVNVCLEGGPSEGSIAVKGKPVCPTLADPTLSSGSATIHLPALTGDAVYGSYTLLDSLNIVVTQGTVGSMPNQGPSELVFSGLGSNAGYTFQFEVIVGTTKIVCEQRFTSVFIPSCISYTAATTSASGTTTTYLACDGTEQQLTIGGVSGYDSQNFCALEGSVNAGVETNITANGPCGSEPIPGKNLTVTSVFATMEPCIGGTIDDYMAANVSLNDTVSMDTNINVTVYWTQLNGGSCASPNTQGFTVFIPAGQSSGSINACTQGAYFPQGALICSAQVTGHDNIVDTINF
jgi:hypothetical protein